MVFFKCKIKKKKEKEEEKDWYLSKYARDYWENIHEEALIRIFEQAEKYLQETIKTAHTITARSYQIFGFALVLLSAVFSYCISGNFNDTKNEIFEWASLFSSLFLFTVIIFCLKVMMPFNLSIVGSKPADYLTETFIKEKKHHIRFLINECNNYQIRIEENVKSNNYRLLYIYRSIFVLILIPCSLFVSWLSSVIVHWIT